MHLFPRFGNHTCFGLFLLHMSFLSMSVHLFSGFCYKAFITFFIDSVNHRTISCCYNVTVYHYMCIILPYKITTTGLAGGLLDPIRVYYRHWSLKTHRNRFAKRNIIYLQSPFGLIFICYVLLAHPKRVNILFQCHLIIFQIIL